MAEPQDTGKPAAQESTPEAKPLIEGTPFKTPEDLAKGYLELQSKLGQQGNEMGTLKSQLSTTQQMLEAFKPAEVKPEAPKGPDYEAMLTEVDVKIAELDVDDKNYTKDLAALNAKGRRIEGQRVQAETAAALTSQFEQKFNEYDSTQAQKQSKQQWLAENPDFQAPEMQQAINDHMATDKYGIQDEYLAYREVQNKQLAGQNQQLQAKIQEYESRLNIKAGEDAAGTVIVDGQSTQAKTTQPKLKGADLESAMSAAYRKAGGA